MDAYRIQRNILLVVDDDILFHAMLVDALIDEGYDVLAARDGVEGLAQVQQRRPDVIVLDLLMPRMDGWKFCRQLRQSDHQKDIPIVLVSAAPGIEQAANELQVARALPKPFDINDLIATLAECVALQTRRWIKGAYSPLDPPSASLK